MIAVELLLLIGIFVAIWVAVHVGFYGIAAGLATSFIVAALFDIQRSIKR